MEPSKLAFLCPLRKRVPSMPKEGKRSLGVDKVMGLELIEQKIILLRGHKVMLDSDLAVLYGVTTKRLNEQMRRNLKRFPSDFMFQLTSGKRNF